jgi:large subunit ribosomal protein L3
MSLCNSLGLLGRKVGMMRLFTDDGDAVPVTVVDVSNNRVAQVKTQANDGYDALQVTFGQRRASRVTKPEAGHLAKAGVEAGEILKEFRVSAEVAGKYAAGSVRAPSSATTSRRSALPTVTAVRTTFRAPSRWRRIRAACSRARR